MSQPDVPERVVIRPRDFFQIGIVVPDLDSAMSQYRVLGYSFCATFEQSIAPSLHDEGGPTVVRLALTREFPHIKLIEAQAAVASGLFAKNSPMRFGVWVDDLETTSAEMEAGGLPRVLAGEPDADGYAPWVYHRLHEGSLVELISRRSQPFFQMLLLGSSDLPG